MEVIKIRTENGEEELYVHDDKEKDINIESNDIDDTLDLSEVMELINENKGS